MTGILIESRVIETVWGTQKHKSDWLSENITNFNFQWAQQTSLLMSLLFQLNCNYKQYPELMKQDENLYLIMNNWNSDHLIWWKTLEEHQWRWLIGETKFKRYLLRLEADCWITWAQLLCFISFYGSVKFSSAFRQCAVFTLVVKPWVLINA